MGCQAGNEGGEEDRKAERDSKDEGDGMTERERTK